MEQERLLIEAAQKDPSRFAELYVKTSNYVYINQVSKNDGSDPRIDAEYHNYCSGIVETPASPLGPIPITKHDGRLADLKKFDLPTLIMHGDDAERSFRSHARSSHRIVQRPADAIDLQTQCKYAH